MFPQFYTDDIIWYAIQLYVVTSMLVAVGIAFFSYSVSRNKKKQGVIGLLLSMLVAAGWLFFFLTD